MDKLKVVDHYSGMGAFEEALINGLGLPPEGVKVVKTEYDPKKVKLWEELHGDKGLDVTHIDDATSKEAKSDNIERILGGKPDIFISSPSCKGFSKLGKEEGLGQTESAYFVDSNTNRVQSDAKSWLHEIIENAAKKENIIPYNMAAKLFGDAYPQQQMVYMLLHNPVLWEKFPEQMRRAAIKFRSIYPSDMNVKTNLVPLGHLNVNRRF